MPTLNEWLGPVEIGSFSATRVGLSTASLRITGMWGEPARRAAAVRTIERALELGVRLVEMPGPFGPWADLVRDADPDPDQVVLIVRLTGSDPANALHVTSRRLGRRLARRVAAVLVEPRLLDDIRDLDDPRPPAGAVVMASTSVSALGPLVAVRGPYPAARRTLEWCEQQRVPYLCPDLRILGAGEHTVALLEPAGRAEMERLWQAAGAAIPPAARPG